MTVADFDEFEVGMLMDIVTTYVNSFEDKQSPNIREATQADFDRF